MYRLFQTIGLSARVHTSNNNKGKELKDDDKRVRVFCTDFVVIIWSRN